MKIIIQINPPANKKTKKNKKQKNNNNRLYQSNMYEHEGPHIRARLSISKNR